MSKKKIKYLCGLEKIIPPAKKPWYVFWKTKPILKKVDFISMDTLPCKEQNVDVYIDGEYFGTTKIKESNMRKTIQVKSKKIIKIDVNSTHKVKVLCWVNNK